MQSLPAAPASCRPLSRAKIVTARPAALKIPRPDSNSCGTRRRMPWGPAGGGRCPHVPIPARVSPSSSRCSRCPFRGAPSTLPRQARPAAPFSPPARGTVPALPRVPVLRHGAGPGTPRRLCLVLPPRPSPKPLIHLSQQEMPKLPFHAGSSARELAALSIPGAGRRCVRQARGIPPLPARSRCA